MSRAPLERLPLGSPASGSRRASRSLTPTSDGHAQKRRRVDAESEAHTDGSYASQQNHKHNLAKDYARVHNGNAYFSGTVNNYAAEAGRTRAADGQSKSLQDVMKSSEFEQIGDRHANIARPFGATCKWLLERPEWENWRDPNQLKQHHGFLWIKGKPGTGKSTIMKFAFDHASKEWQNDVPISYFFHARGQDLERDWPINLLKGLLEDAVAYLKDERLVCFIDALDECSEDEIWDLVSFLEELGEKAVEQEASLHICLSSRHYPHITFEKGVQLVLERQEGHQQDMEDYVKYLGNVNHELDLIVTYLKNSLRQASKLPDRQDKYVGEEVARFEAIRARIGVRPASLIEAPMLNEIRERRVYYLFESEANRLAFWKGPDTAKLIYPFLSFARGPMNITGICCQHARTLLRRRNRMVIGIEQAKKRASIEYASVFLRSAQSSIVCWHLTADRRVSCSLFKLPKELRYTIYDLVLGPDEYGRAIIEVITIPDIQTGQSRIELLETERPALLRTNSALCDEAAASYWEHSLVYLHVNIGFARGPGLTSSLSHSCGTIDAFRSLQSNAQNSLRNIEFRDGSDCHATKPSPVTFAGSANLVMTATYAGFARVSLPLGDAKATNSMGAISEHRKKTGMVRMLFIAVCYEAVQLGQKLAKSVTAKHGAREAAVLSAVFN
ncbi:Putative P-loop containing nucleoside triphosphate hydrolase [Septoria linicola]|uniref:P-loop containing nucleoside triphosphate hydrolase n=1 Tax=Septoria linicola TaxID=215465 RepID=A0A9Q9EGF2_9PEZI|nr:Putative P-loop containing nucleoside triphosphate hydrolase [Septoria linicola]